MLMTRFDIRLSDEMAEQIHKAVSERGFESVTAFIRQAISDELRNASPPLGEMEGRIAGSYDRLTKEVRRLQTAQQVQCFFPSGATFFPRSAVFLPSRCTGFPSSCTRIFSSSAADRS